MCELALVSGLSGVPALCAAWWCDCYVRAPLWEEEEEEDGKEEGGVVEPEGKEVEAARPRRRWRLSSPVLAELVQGKLVQDDADYASAPLQLTKRALEVSQPRCRPLRRRLDNAVVGS